MTLINDKTITSQTTRAVPTPLLLWLTSGTIVAVLFEITWLIDGAIRPDYNPWKHSVSALSLGPGGWVQQVNFVAFGIITILTVFAWKKFLKSGVGEIWYPIIKCVYGLSLIVVGFFITDPDEGYPKDVVFVSSTFTGVVHNLSALVGFVVMVIGYFILAKRFTREPNWRGWTAYSIITAILIIVILTGAGVIRATFNDFFGLFQRLGVSLDLIWGIVFFTRLWMGAGFGVFQKKDGTPA